MFDLPADKAAADLAQWAPILEWLQPVLKPVAVPEVRREPVLPVRRPSVLGARPLNEGRGVLEPRMTVSGPTGISRASTLA
jgi:hypothetical protein